MNKNVHGLNTYLTAPKDRHFIGYLKALLVLLFVLPLSAQNVFVWDGEAANLSGSAWNTFLQSKGYTVTYPAVNDTLPSNYSNYDAIFLCFGVYTGNHQITVAEATDILNYANAGGKVYIEGGDIFGYDPGKTQVQQLCGLSGATDGSAITVNASTPIAGQTGTLTQGMNFIGYTGQNNWIDVLTPSTSETIFENPTGTVRAVQYDNGTYRAVGMSFDLGGLTDGTSPSTKDSLMGAILSFLNGTLDLPPTTPQNLYANPGDDQLTLAWDPVDDADLAMYKIYRGKNTWSINLLDSVSVSATPDTVYVDNVVDNDTMYYYYVIAVDSAGQVSGNSDTVHVMPTIIPDGLVAFYKFDGNTLDGSGEENDGINYGATLTYDRFGNWGRAYSFDGISNYIYASPDSQLNIINSFSLSLWLKWNGDAGAGNDGSQSIVDKSYSGNDMNYRLAIEETNKTLGSHLAFLSGSSEVHSNNPITIGAWHHVLITYANPTLTIYIDNEIDYTNTSFILQSVNNGPLLIGDDNLPNTYERFFNGVVDEVRIYDRALSVSEVQTLFEANGWDPPPATPTDLTAEGGNGFVELNWDQVDDADLTKYRIYRRTATTSLTLIDSVVAASPPDTFYTDNSVINDTTYYYQVTAVDSGGNSSGYSNEASASPSATTTVELLAGAGTTSSGAGDQGYPLNTY